MPSRQPDDQAALDAIRSLEPAIPTLLLRGGRVAARQTGAVPLAALRAWVDNALATAAH